MKSSIDKNIYKDKLFKSGKNKSLKINKFDIYIKTNHALYICSSILLTIFVTPYVINQISIVFLIIFIALVSIIICFKIFKPNVNSWHYGSPQYIRLVCSKSCLPSKGELYGTINLSYFTPGQCHKQYGFQYCKYKLKD
jgi:hypothetical protein